MQVEEKNKKIELYIEDKIKELESNSMYVPNENKEKLLMAFMNRNEDIEIIKTRIDTIFNNSVAAYKENMEKVGFPYEDVVVVYEKICKMNKTTAKMYLRGGIVPYLLLGEASKRKHSNLDFLCSKKDIPMIRELFRKNDYYDPKRDSLTYTINNIDYGFQVIVDKVKVNIAVFEENDNGIIEYSFDCHNRIGVIKNINAKLSEYIMPYVSSDNKKYMTLSLELIVADKLMLNRDKDREDIEKIKECNGISEERIKKIPLPIVKKVKLVGDNLEFTTTMPRIKLDIPKRQKSMGFINIGTILLLIAVVVCFILGNR